MVVVLQVFDSKFCSKCGLQNRLITTCGKNSRNDRIVEC